MRSFNGAKNSSNNMNLKLLPILPTLWNNTFGSVKFLIRSIKSHFLVTSRPNSINHLIQYWVNKVPRVDEIAATKNRTEWENLLSLNRKRIPKTDKIRKIRQFLNNKSPKTDKIWGKIYKMALFVRFSEILLRIFSERNMLLTLSLITLSLFEWCAWQEVSPLNRLFFIDLLLEIS